MKASEIIKKLLNLIVQHGDQEVVFANSDNVIETIEVDPEFEKSHEYTDPESVKIFHID